MTGNIGLSARGATIAGRGSVRLVGAARSAPRALEPLPGRVNHLVGDDTMCGLGGNDHLAGFRGDDRLFGDACGRGILALARAGNDQVNGGPGADLLVGGGGNDVIRPGPGRDRINAGRGRDRIDARDGTRDRVRCGPGRDAVTAHRRDRLRRCEMVVRR